MPADSLLTQKLKTTAPGTTPLWDRIEAAVEVLAEAVSGAAIADLEIGVYNVTPPTLNDGQETNLQTDVNANLKVVVSNPVGVPNLSVTQVTATSSAAILAPIRVTRRTVTFDNIDATNPVYVGPATVSSTAGRKIPPNGSCSFTYTGLFQVIAPAGSPIVVVSDEYD